MPDQVSWRSTSEPNVYREYEPSENGMEPSFGAECYSAKTYLYVPEYLFCGHERDDIVFIFSQKSKQYLFGDYKGRSGSLPEFISDDTLNKALIGTYHLHVIWVKRNEQSEKYIMLVCPDAQALNEATIGLLKKEDERHKFYETANAITIFSPSNQEMELMFNYLGNKKQPLPENIKSEIYDRFKRKQPSRLGNQAIEYISRNSIYNHNSLLFEGNNIANILPGELEKEVAIRATNSLDL